MASVAEAEKRSFLGAVRKARNKMSFGVQSWPAYGSSWADYTRDFSRYGLQEPDVPALITSRSNPAYVAIDLMSDHVALTTLFNSIKDNTGLIGLSVHLPGDIPIRNSYSECHSQVTDLYGDITEPSTWRLLSRRLDGKLADLIIERGFGGLDCLPHHPRFYAILLNKAWTLLSPENGQMILQTPHYRNWRGLGIDMQKWLSLLAYHGVTAEYKHIDYGVLRLVKSDDSLRMLPFLD